jgi:hypothetical protein
MNKNNRGKGPTLNETRKGDKAFWKALLSSPKNAAGMVLSLLATSLEDAPYSEINADQNDILKKNPQRIAIFVPWFQLWWWSMDALKHSFNEVGVPVLFPEKLPSWFQAVICRDHPEVLEAYIQEYVEQIRLKYPHAEIILLWHSYAGAQVAHVAGRLKDDNIVPVAMTPTLGPSGEIANAFHGLYFRPQSDVFSGRTDYLSKAAQSLSQHPRGIVLHDKNDWWLPTEVQLWLTSNNPIPKSKVLDMTQEGEGSFGHYNQNLSLKHARRTTHRLLSFIDATKPQ